MFSKEFMRYLLNYQPDGYEVKEEKTVKTIEFRENKNGTLAKVYLTVKSR